MSYQPQKLVDKLSGVTETQESIQGISQWIMFHKRHAKTSADTWADFTMSCPMNLKLGLIYVANEVVQQAKNAQREEFVEAFSKVLPRVISKINEQVPAQVQDRITRVVNVWKDRRIFSKEVIADIEGQSNGGSFFSSTPAKGTANVPPPLVNLVQTFSKLQTFRPPTLPNDTAAARSAIAASKDQISQQLAVVQAVQSQLETLGVDIASQKESLAANMQALDDKLMSLEDEEELPSPAIEADSEPEVYTASAAMNDDDDDDDDDDLEEVEEDESKQQPKLELDPKLASFLASMQ